MVVPVVAAIIFNSDKRLHITQRMPDSHFAGFWEFPGGRVEADESEQMALIREIKEELHADITINNLFWRSRFDYEIKTVEISFYLCSFADENQRIEKIEIADYRWIQKEELTQFTFPPADTVVISQLLKSHLF